MWQFHMKRSETNSFLWGQTLRENGGNVLMATPKLKNVMLNSVNTK